MSNRLMRKTVLSALTAFMISTVGVCSAAPSPQLTGMVGMPNPIVEYGTYETMADTIGFTPLYLPKASGYNCNYISVIGKKMADVGFQRREDANSKLRIRTAQQENFSNDDISGIYSAAWEQKNINDVTVSVAKIKESSYAAHWKVGKYLFAVQAESISYGEFMALLSDSLVDLTVHYYR